MEAGTLKELNVKPGFKGVFVPQDDVIRLTQVPAELRAMGVSLNYGKAWRLVASGELATVRDGGKVFVTRAALRDYAKRAGA